LDVDTASGIGLSSLVVVDVATERTEAVIGRKGAAPTGLAIDPNRSGTDKTFNAGAQASDLAAKVIITATSTVTAVVRSGGGVDGAAVSSDGKWAYLLESGVMARRAVVRLSADPSLGSACRTVGPSVCCGQMDRYVSEAWTLMGRRTQAA
jgi:DNA-binding beta-propeller fold protein YncE